MDGQQIDTLIKLMYFNVVNGKRSQVLCSTKNKNTSLNLFLSRNTNRIVLCVLKMPVALNRNIELENGYQATMNDLLL